MLLRPGGDRQHMIEALGVPHTEVELVLVNGESVGFDRLLEHGDRVAVFPRFEMIDVTPMLRVREHPLRVTHFLADAHLGAAHLLRMAGFDTLYDNNFQDSEIEIIAVRDSRIVLKRDRELLKRRSITHGCFVHTLKPPQQLCEIFDRLDLARSVRPFTLCLHCNAPLRPIEKAQALVVSLLPCASASITSALATSASASSGKGRIGIACGQCWRHVSIKRPIKILAIASEGRTALMSRGSR